MKLNEVDQANEIKTAGEIVQKMFALENISMHWESDAKPTIRGLVKQLDNPFLLYITSDLETFLHYGQKYIELDRSNVFDNVTKLPTYDDMLGNPEYFATKKSQVFKIFKIYPKLYRTYAKQGFRGLDGDFKPEENLILDYAKQVLDGSKMPLPYLRYELVKSKLRGEYTSFGQEGRHRAIVAELLNVHKMPVMVIAGIDPPTSDTNKLNQFSEEIWAKFK